MGTNKVASVILLDVSKSMNNQSDNGETFFERSINCINKMILRKMFSQDNDELGIVLFGTDETNNDLARSSLYNNISTFSNVSLVNWDLFRKVENLKMSNTFKSDWIEALIVAMDFIRTETQGRRYRSKQIVVFSSFSEDISGTEQTIEPLVNALEGEKISLIVVGNDIEEETHSGSKELPNSLHLIFNTVSKLDAGVHYSFSEIEDELMYFDKKRKMCRLLKVNLQIGSNIQLPVRWMKFTNEQTRFKWDFPPSTFLKTAAEAPRDRIEPSTKNVEFLTDSVKTTNFGRTMVDLSYADIQAMSRKTGPSSFIYMGNVKSSRISRSMFVSNDIYVVVPDKDVRSVAMFSAFVDALLKANKYGIARRVPVNNGKVTIGALLPVSDQLGKALFFMKLPYAEWVQKVPEKYLSEPDSKEGEKAIDDLIDAAMLPEDLCEEGKGILLRDPTFQSRCHALYLRAVGKLPPGSILDIPEHIQRLVNPHPMSDAAKEALHRIAEIFPFTENPPPPPIDSIKDPVKNEADITDDMDRSIKQEITEEIKEAVDDTNLQDFADAFNEEMI